jgi:hypothetical protein
VTELSSETMIHYKNDSINEQKNYEQTLNTLPFFNLTFLYFSAYNLKLFVFTKDY